MTSSRPLPMRDLRSFLAAEIAAGRGFYPPGAARLQRAAADPARPRPRRDSRAGSLPRPRAGDGAVVLGSGRGHPTPVAPQHLRRARNRPRSPRAGLRRSHPVGRARRAPPQQRAHRRPGSSCVACRQGLGRVHRSRDRRALGAARGHRVPALGTLRPAEGSDRRHGAPPRADGSPSVPVLREQRLLRLSPLLPGKCAARRATGWRPSTGGWPSPYAAQGRARPSNSGSAISLAASLADRCGTRRRESAAARPGGRRRRRCRRARRRAAPTRCAPRVAPCPPTSDGALRHRIHPRSASGRTLSGSAATARQRSGWASTGTSPSRLDQLGRVDDRGDRILDVEPRARETRSGPRGCRRAPRSSGSFPAISLGNTSQPRRRSSPQAATSLRISASDSA